jgi:uncharacterized protein
LQTDFLKFVETEKMNIIKREKYIEEISKYANNEIIKVIVGQRRVGKSYFTKQLIDFIKENQPAANIIYLNLELFEFSTINTAEKLVNYIESKSQTTDNAIFIDEIQEIKDFERAVRHFFTKNYNIYITGSNSSLLSGELATMLSGRYIQFRINPLNFSEFCQFHNLDKNQDAVNLFIKFGGMPFLKNLELEEEIVYTYLRNIYQTILLKDIVARYNLKNVDFLERLVLFLADNTGSIVSAKKITDFLKSQNMKISNSVILNYLQYIDNAFFINKTKRYDLQGKRYLEIGEKYYFTDVGIRNALVGFKPQDMNKILENVVFSHLLTMGYTVSIGKLNNLEIDFIAEKNNDKVYIQVAYLLSDEKVIEREFGKLHKINDSYNKYVVSLDPFQFDNKQGIQHLTLLNFLLKNKI